MKRLADTTTQDVRHAMLQALVTLFVVVPGLILLVALILFH